MATAMVKSVETAQHALTIPRLAHAEAEHLALTELERVLHVVAQLAGDDWSQPTDCTGWSVLAMVAHLAGACASYARGTDFRRQVIRNPYLKTEPMMIDGINRRQIEDRAGREPAELVAELREVGPRAIRMRQRVSRVVGDIPVPFGPPLGVAPVRYLLQTIYTRDQWMHRLDLCRATGKHMVVTGAHDGRIIDLVMRDVALKLKDRTPHAGITLELTGALSAVYHFGAGAPVARIVMDAFEFNRLASERLTPAAAYAGATITGDETAAHWFMENCAVTY